MVEFRPGAAGRVKAFRAQRALRRPAAEGIITTDGMRSFIRDFETPFDAIKPRLQIAEPPFLAVEIAMHGGQIAVQRLHVLPQVTLPHFHLRHIGLQLFQDLQQQIVTVVSHHDYFLYDPLWLPPQKIANKNKKETPLGAVFICFTGFLSVLRARNPALSLGFERVKRNDRRIRQNDRRF